MQSPELIQLAEIPDAVLVVSRDRSVVAANAAAEELFGYGRGELAGLRLGALIPERYRRRHERLVQEFFAQPGVGVGVMGREVTALKRDGREFTAQISLRTTGSGSFALAVLRDITPAVQVRDKLQEAEQRFRIAASHSADLIQHVNVEKDLYIWYGDIDGLTGHEPGGFPRTISGWLDLMHPDDADRVAAEVERIIENGEESWNVRYRIRAKDGSYRHWVDRGTVTVYVDGRGNEGIGGIIDETEAVLAQQKLQRALSEVAELKDRLQAESEYLRDEIRTSYGFDEIIGTGPAIAAVLQQVESVAETNATVLLLGETGTGKELVARAIHSRSRRKDRPLIKVDCGTLAPSLIESELFGHEKGAFTGAHESKEGRFELAHGGTIFLDEISELPVDLQSKLLRVLEEGVAQRVGSKRERKVDVRIIVASNRDLRLEMREGRFRSDLYYRVNVFPIESPPLRERREDIPLLVSHFLSLYVAAFGKKIHSVAQTSMDGLVAYDWPGNIRELRNVIERSVILCPGDTLEVAEALVGAQTPSRAPSGMLKQDLLAVERSRIVHALEESNWKIKGANNAASHLGLTSSTLRSRMKSLGIARPS
jgi:PAS domain S-box-containing protein